MHLVSNVPRQIVSPNVRRNSTEPDLPRDRQIFLKPMNERSIRWADGLKDPVIPKIAKGRKLNQAGTVSWSHPFLLNLWNMYKPHLTIRNSIYVAALKFKVSQFFLLLSGI